MINLVKNELLKIRKRKCIYIILAMVFGYTVLMPCMEDKFEDALLNVDNRISTLESAISSYDTSNEYEREYYISDSIDLEVLKEQKKVGYGTFKSDKIEEIGRTYIDCYVTNEINNNTEEASLCKTQYNEFYNELINHDYLYYYSQDRNNEIATINDLKLQLQETTSDIEKENLNKEIIEANAQLDYYNYLINEKLDPDKEENENRINAIESLLEYTIKYEESKKDRTQYTNAYDYSEYLDIESGYYKYKYIVENHEEDNLVNNKVDILLSSDYAYASIFVVIIIAMVVGSIISEEYNKGTIKQLLIRPYSRIKIFISKLIASIIVLLILLLIRYVMELIIYGIYYGFDLLKLNEYVYSYGTHTVTSVNLVLYYLLKIVCLLPEYIIIILFAMFVSTISLSSSVATALTLGVGFADYINDLILYGKSFKFMELLPFNCWNLGEYLFGNLPIIMNASLAKSLIVDIIVITILLVLSIVVFKKRDIKNQ